MKVIHLIIQLVLAATAISASAAPANDDFANRANIGVGTVSLDIKTATVEAGEPETTRGHTVWYTYTATSDLIVTLDDTGSNFGYSFMSVFMGDSINALTRVDSAYNGSSSASVRQISFPAKAGTVFQMCFGRYEASGDPSLSLQVTLFTTPFVYSGSLYGPGPPTSQRVSNDYFSNRMSIAGNSITAINYMRDAGVEPGEPLTSVGNSVWYTWTAPGDSIVTVGNTVEDLRYNHVSVYMGNSINNLIEIGSARDESPILSFKAKAGTVYQICCHAFAGGDAYGAYLQLNLTTVPLSYPGVLYYSEVPTAPTPTNDSFNTPQVLTGNLLTVIGSAASATTEPGEQEFERTLWHSWTAPANKLVSIDVPAGTNAGFSVYTGSPLQSAVRVEPRSDSNPLSYKFNAVAGVTYKLVIGSTSSQHQFTLVATDPPVNNGPESKITYPRNGQIVPRKGFNFNGTFKDKDGDAIVAYEFIVNGKAVVKNKHPSNESRYSGRLKKGKLTLKMRARDSLGKWGPYHTIKVTAK